eukprot:TRINITY_DN74258_c0_g1_i1.p1 TRINITY_DN74258_c0_g1~~TRINITY_DN74258_c0_g1_i1.p1  ORF type:complete len:596 (-),score=109.62 TRINITY_DN74258_c0_g1_i1:106-1893(-)
MAPIDIDALTEQEFQALPLVIRGESKEIRYAGGGMVVIRFLPTIYSFTQNRSGHLPGSDALRLRADQILVQVLKANGIDHVHEKNNERFCLSRLVMPHPYEFAKYGLPEFVPTDLSAAEISKLPRAPPVEVIIKVFHGGTSKDRYRAMQTTCVRSSHPLFGGLPVLVDTPYPQPLVRFDWRNALTMEHDPAPRPSDAGAQALAGRWLDELGAARATFGSDSEFRRIDEFLKSLIKPSLTRVADEILPEGLADSFIDIARARVTALNIHHVLQTFLDSCDIVCNDLCLFISEDGGTVYGEISQDCGRFRHYDLGSLDKDVWRTGGGPEQVLAKWRAFSELLEDGWRRAQAASLLFAVPRVTDEPLLVYVGTTNPHKISELATLIQHLNIRLVPTEALDIEEPYCTFKENARLKALEYARRSGGVTIAEDSGMSVEALGGLPGPWSARFSDYRQISPELGCHGGVQQYVASGRSRAEIDASNNDLVLQLMTGAAERAAALHIHLCVATPDEVLFEASASSDGFISHAKRGHFGFGYDPIFIGADTFELTYAELDPCRKNLRSHRRKVCKELAAWLAAEGREKAAAASAVLTSAGTGC